LPRERRFEIDWLRVLAVLWLLPYHCARAFDTRQVFYAESGSKSPFLSNLLMAWTEPWHMPILFLLAGASTFFALQFRSAGQYVGERAKRLLVPFFFGVLLIVPPQVYVGLVTHSGYPGSFFRWYPQFFRLNEDLSGYATGNFTPAHLWFILFLFLFALLALPLFLWLRRPSGQRFVERLSRLVRWPGVLFLFATPIVGTQRLPDLGGQNPFSYLVWFILGFLVVSHDRFDRAIDRIRLPALVLGPVFLAAFYLIRYVDAEILWRAPDVFWSTLFPFMAWSTLLAALGYGRRFLHRTNRFLSYASAAAYPFYVLHQTVIILVAWLVIGWRLEAGAGYLVLLTLATVTTWLCYELLVRRWRPIRFLFGMKPRTAKPRASSSPS